MIKGFFMTHMKSALIGIGSALLMIVVGVMSSPANAITIVGHARVVDGDTLIVQGVRVRLEGIDAPERDQACLDPRRNGRVACGAMATSALSEAIGGREVFCQLAQRDRYGRHVGRCFLGQHGSGVFGRRQDLSLAMVASGWAIAYMAEARPELIVAEQAARLRRIGIWAFTFERPADVRSRGG